MAERGPKSTANSGGNVEQPLAQRTPAGFGDIGDMSRMLFHQIRENLSRTPDLGERYLDLSDAKYMTARAMKLARP